MGLQAAGIASTGLIDRSDAFSGNFALANRIIGRFSKMALNASTRPSRAIAQGGSSSVDRPMAPCPVVVLGRRAWYE